MMEPMDPDNLPAGTMVDSWRVVRRLDGGAYGTVYLVEKGGDFYAMKVARYREHSLDARHTDERAQQELSCLLSLRHRHIARVWAHGRWPHPREGFFYVVMDYVEGYTLDEWVERARATPHEVVVLLDKVFEAVASMHAQGIFHRDLKPGNILVSAKDGEPVVVDYGVASFPVPARPQLTDTRLPPGTPRYTSPEALRFEAEHRHDRAARYEFKVTDELYALGVTLYDVLTDPQPYSHPQPQPLGLWGVTLAHEVNERVPVPLSRFAATLLERAPAKRPVSAEAARRNIAELLPLQAEPWTKRPLHPLPPQALAEAVPVEAVPVAPREVVREALVPGPVAPVPGPVGPVRAEAPPADTPPRAAARPSPSRRWSRTRAVALGTAALGVLLVWRAYLSRRGAAQERQESSAPAAEEAALRPRPPPAGAEPPAPPPALSPLSTQPLPQPPPAQPVSNPEKGTPVNVRQSPEGAIPPPCSQKQPPPRGTPQWRAWCKCAAIVGTLAASQAGCPAVQVRQSLTAECTAESVAAMQLLDVEFDTQVLSVQLDVKQPCPECQDSCTGPEACIHDGPLTSRVLRGSGKLVPGTLLSGQAWNKPTGAYNRPVFRWTEATLPDGNKHPVCIEAGGDRDLCPDGVSTVQCAANQADIVKRWDRPLTR